jgi:nucleoside-diphosphate-sugar epimerase
MQKVFNVSRMRQWLGYECRTSLREGLRKTIEWFDANHRSVRLKTAL